MRLINVHTYQIHEFFGGSIPRYAILSHTWGDDEVTLRDMKLFVVPALLYPPSRPWLLGKRGLTKYSYRQNSFVESKLAFKKIRYTCWQAKVHGLNWAWVDTCCINKGSSAELSEAINSMFHWYHNAAECYAYLEDVPDSGYVLLKPGPKLLARFEASRWFSRGWTLQELLASQKVFFFGTTWKAIGDRSSLCGFIAHRTRIPEELLSSTNNLAAMLSKYSIAQRMSWAADRRCARIEDTAYCLLGLFDINMPLLYGEGTRAFRRLQQELLASTDDHSLLAWNLPRGSELSWTLSGVLASSPSDFRESGRVVRLHEELGSLSQLTRRGLEISLVLDHPPFDNLLFPFSKYSPWPVHIAILNCALDTGMSRRRMILPLVRDYGAENTAEHLTCYARLAVPQKLSVTDHARYQYVQGFQTIFLRTHRHEIVSNPLLEPLKSPALEQIRIHIHGLPGLGIHGSGDKNSPATTRANEESLGYTMRSVSYKTDGLRLGEQDEPDKSTWGTTGTYFSLHISLSSNTNMPPLKASCGFERAGTNRGLIFMALEYGLLPHESVRFRRYADVESVRGSLAKFSICVGGVVVILEFDCQLTWHKDGGQAIAKFGERMQVHMKFTFRSALSDHIGTGLEDESILPWSIVDFRSIFEKTGYYLAQQSAKDEQQRHNASYQWELDKEERAKRRRIC